MEGRLAMILGARTHTVRRVAAGSYSLTTGAWADGSTTTLAVVGSWQPMPAREREALPEGYRTRAAARLFCAPDQPVLYPVRPDTRQRPDVVERDGVRHLVVSVSEWTDHAGGVPHRAYGLVEIGPDEEVRP